MTKRLIIFEDSAYANLYPLTLSRSVFSLRCGMNRLWQKIARRFAGYEIAFSCRPEVAGLLGAQTGIPVNAIDYNPGDRLVFVNGRLRLGDELANDLLTAADNRIYHHGNATVAVVVTDKLQKMIGKGIRFSGESASEALGIKADIIAGEFEFYNYLWDLVNLNGDEINLDYLAMEDGPGIGRMVDQARIDSSVRILSEKNLFIASGAEIGAGAVIDNRQGPVIIDKEAAVGPLSFIEGPCYIGPGTRIFRGNIRSGCTFGSMCRVGGEVEQSIFHGFSNKYHDGFMGHAYLGSWVNLGAMTTNSDLKNNYRSISVTLNGREMDTGHLKIGSFIGDHSKTGIGTLINTGVSIGFSCNIFGGTLVTSREVPSFSWGDEKGYDVYRLDKAIDVARTSMSRRNQAFSTDHEELFATIFNQTAAGR
jgi:UDP-N-acetylglucosamine diphosphorylase/glucosamine-1-phosphate N-acetyltransferase